MSFAPREAAGRPLLLQHGLGKCLAYRFVGKLVGMLPDPFQRHCLDFLKVIMHIVLAAITLDLAHLFAHAGTEQRLLIDEGDAHQVAMFAPQAPGNVAQKAHVGIERRHAHFQCRAMTPGAVIIASHAPEADSVQLLPGNTLRFEQGQFHGYIVRMRNESSHEHGLHVSAI